MKTLFKLFLLCLCLTNVAFAAKDVSFEEYKKTHNIVTKEDLAEQYHAEYPTPCANKIYAQALYDKSDEVDEMDEEYIVRAWAHGVMQQPDVIRQVLECPEVKSLLENPETETQTIIFEPIVYEFPNGRSITINYTTQPKVLRQRELLARKPSIPTGKASVKLGGVDPEDSGIYLNTDPSWYAIFVAQHDSLKDLVGPGKDNTVSVKYITDNISKIYPKGYWCTSRSAWANDSDTINQVVRKFVSLEHDTNDYYVAGDINLEWVMYAEIFADIVITLATAGGGQLATGALKSLRATRAAKNLIKSVKTLRKMDKVKDFINVSRKITQHTDDIAKLEKNIKNAKKYNKLVAKGKGGTKEAEELLKSAQKIDSKMTADKLQDIDKLKDERDKLKQSVKTLEKEADEMAKADENVKLYKDSMENLTEVMKYRRDLKAFKRKETGNIITRPLKKMLNIRKTLKAVNGGGKVLRKADRAARAGMSSRMAKIGDWLKQSSIQNGARIAKFERNMGFIYGAATFMGDMYDRTSTTSKEYSNGIEFKPFCLLSADDLEGQENVVNYGMWFMWEGNSVDPADDDAAYLQAMDFAAKFYYTLDEFQERNAPYTGASLATRAIHNKKVLEEKAKAEKEGREPEDVPLPVPGEYMRLGGFCDVDIYVVHPFIRLDESNPDDVTGEMFYLFMNEVPWTTHKQFSEKVKDINGWLKAQEKLEKEDPWEKTAPVGKRDDDEAEDPDKPKKTEEEIKAEKREKNKWKPKVYAEEEAEEAAAAEEE